jgi:hypothetical protein
MSSLQSLNPFGDRGYVQLPTTEGPGAPLPAPSRREEEEAWFACESTWTFPAVSFPRHVSLFAPPHGWTDIRCRTCAGSACGHVSDRPTPDGLRSLDSPITIFPRP